MGNNLKKNAKNQKKENKPKQKDKKEQKTEEELINDNPEALVLTDDISTNMIDLKRLNYQKHSNKKDPIEEVIVHPKFENSIIIACRSGQIKLYTNILKMYSNNNNEVILHDFKQRIHSMILLKKNDNNIAVGLNNFIVILSINNNNLLEKEIELKNSQLKEIRLLELDNGNIISAGESFIYWVKENKEYKDDNNIIKIDITKDGGGNIISKIINMVDFPEFNTILATQENTHLIYYMKYNKTKIELIKKIENCPSIWYKGSAQKLSDYYMLLVGKFELNVIDASNGEVTNKYLGIDRGTLLNMKQSNNKENIWIVSDYCGKYFEFYIQEGNDLIIIDKIYLDEKSDIRFNHKLIRINDECFVAVNHYGEIYTFKLGLNEQYNLI